jgi:hypothetical protein
MFKQLATISVATLTTLGTLAISIESASAMPRPGRGLSFGGHFNPSSTALRPGTILRDGPSAMPRPGQSIAINQGYGGPTTFGTGVQPPSIKPSPAPHRHVRWGLHYGWGAYAAPAYAAYAQPCYFVRRPAGLFKVCPVY